MLSGDSMCDGPHFEKLKYSISQILDFTDCLSEVFLKHSWCLLYFHSIGTFRSRGLISFRDDFLARILYQWGCIFPIASYQEAHNLLVSFLFLFFA